MSALRFLVISLALVACSNEPRGESDAARSAPQEVKQAPPDARAPANEAAPAGDEARSAASAATKTIAITTQDPPQVTLIEAGSAPHQPLRFTPTAGTVDPLRMTMETTMAMRSPAGAAPEIRMPPIVAQGTVTVDRVAGDQIFSRQAIESLDIQADDSFPPEVLSALGSVLDGFDGLVARIELDSRGVLRAGEVDMPQSLPPQLQQMMSQMTQNLGQMPVPMPAEALGKGARWVALSRIDNAGMKLEQTAKYHLVAIDGPHCTVEVEVVQKLLEKTFAPPGTTGTIATVDRFASTGGGKLAFDLAHLVPQQAEIHVKTSFDMQVAARGQTQAQSLDMNITARFERLAREP